MLHFKKVKISEKRPYVINLSWEEIEMIVSNMPRHPRKNKKEYNIVNRLRTLIYDERKKGKEK